MSESEKIKSEELEETKFEETEPKKIKPKEIKFKKINPTLIKIKNADKLFNPIISVFLELIGYVKTEGAQRIYYNNLYKKLYEMNSYVNNHQIDSYLHELEYKLAQANNVIKYEGVKDVNELFGL